MHKALLISRSGQITVIEAIRLDKVGWPDCLAWYSAVSL